MKGIENILRENRDLVDRKIEEYIPKKCTEEYLKFLCGNSEGIDLSAFERSISAPSWDFLSRGGKRWRAFLFQAIYKALNNENESGNKNKNSGEIDIIKLSTIPEIIHNGTLMVDDIEDSSTIRRGRPCIHTMKEFGVDIAINCGNALYFIPLVNIMRSSIEQEKKVKIYEIYLQEMINISIGQGTDIAWHKGNDGNITVEKYLKMCALKTGTLARMSAKIAAVLGGANDETTEKIGKFVESLGVAFQIQDDILDLSGREEKFGKKIGEDIKEGKRSIMVIYVLTNKDADEKDKKRLVEILDMHTDDKILVSEAISIINKYNSIQYAEKYAEKIVKDSWADAEKLFKESESKKLLEELKDYLIKREI